MAFLLCACGSLWSPSLLAQDALTQGVCSGQLYGGTITAGFKAMGLCSQGSQPNAAAAAKIAAIQQNLRNNQQLVGQIGNALPGFLGLFQGNGNSTNSPGVPAPPDPAANAALAQARLNNAAANLLATVNSMLPPPSSAAPGTPAQPDANATLYALLDDGPPSNTSTAAINSLLGDSTQQGAGDSTATAAVNNLLAGDDAPPPAVNVPSAPNAPQPGDPFYQPPAPSPSQWYTPPAPLQDQDMNTDLQNSVDQPNPSMFDTLKQELQSGAQGVKQEATDTLNGLVNAGESLIAPVVNDPGLQAIYYVLSKGGATMPLTIPTDSGDAMVRNVAGQAWLGSTDIIKGKLYTAGTKMNDQYTAYMGWAQASGGTQP